MWDTVQIMVSVRVWDRVMTEVKVRVMIVIWDKLFAEVRDSNRAGVVIRVSMSVGFGVWDSV